MQVNGPRRSGRYEALVSLGGGQRDDRRGMGLELMNLAELLFTGLHGQDLPGTDAARGISHDNSALADQESQYTNPNPRTTGDPQRRRLHRLGRVTQVQ